MNKLQNVLETIVFYIANDISFSFTFNGETGEAQLDAEVSMD